MREGTYMEDGLYCRDDLDHNREELEHNARVYAKEEGVPFILVSSPTEGMFIVPEHEDEFLGDGEIIATINPED